MSTAAGPFERADLVDVLRTARSRNGARDISGVLLYRHGRFLQLLEGSAAEVGPVYRSILADPRHTDVRCVWAAHNATRWFSEWSMGFRDLTDDPITHPGYVNLLTDSGPGTPCPSTVYELWELLRHSPADTPSLHPEPVLPSMLVALRDNVRRGLARSVRLGHEDPQPTA